MGELVCKMVPHSIPYGAPFGGTTEITQTDIAAALSYLKLNDFETRYIRACLLDAEPWGPTSPLGYDAWDWVVGKAIAGSWQIPQGKETLRRLSFVALATRIDRRQFVCGSCNGAGVVLTGSLLAKCGACQGERADPVTGQLIGDGRRQRSDRFYGRLLGVNHETYRQTWAPRLNGLLADLHAIEDRVIWYLRTAVFDS